MHVPYAVPCYHLSQLQGQGESASICSARACTMLWLTQYSIPLSRQLPCSSSRPAIQLIKLSLCTIRTQYSTPIRQSFDLIATHGWLISERGRIDSPVGVGLDSCPVPLGAAHQIAIWYLRNSGTRAPVAPIPAPHHPNAAP